VDKDRVAEWDKAEPKVVVWENVPALQIQGTMNKKIAIPVEGGLLCAHFGHCEQFYFAEIENGEIVKEETITPPEHQPGVYPAWVKQQGATVVIAGGIGGKAKDLFAKESISIYAGIGTSEPRKLVEAFIDGALSILEGTCNHDHEHHNCGH
jgi:predicted Fe-Mo cluster-binding NifX family protein